MYQINNGSKISFRSIISEDIGIPYYELLFCKKADAKPKRVRAAQGRDNTTANAPGMRAAANAAAK